MILFCHEFRVIFRGPVAVEDGGRLKVCFMPALRHRDKRRRSCRETFTNVACWRNSFIMDPVMSYDAVFKSPLLRL